MWLLGPTVVLFISMLGMAAVVWLWTRVRARDRKSPFSKDLLRSPGESLRAQLDDKNLEVAGYLVLSLVPLLWAYACYTSALAFSPEQATRSLVLTLVVLGGGGYIALMWQLWRLFLRRRDLTLGYEAELAVGQALHELARHGYHVFHDLPLKRSNVDHVVVGRNGVFAIETKGRAKPRQRTERPMHEVEYDGSALHFPGWKETKPLQQAERQAKWVSEFLSGAVGEHIEAQPILVLPGWYVRPTKPRLMPVLAAPGLVKYLPKLRSGQDLDESLIRRIVFQLDQRCRSVAPRAYQEDLKEEPSAR